MFKEVASAGSLPPRVLRRRLRDIVSALGYLHAQGIAHLDLKLENVVLSNSNSAKLIDFGCAAPLDQNDPAASLGGTLHYLPPELAQDPKFPPAATTDAWSLGVLAYTAIAGAYPFNGAQEGASEASNDRATRHRIVHAQPHRIPSCIDLPSDLRRIVYGLLEKDPAKRMTIPQVAKELGISLDASAAVVKAGDNAGKANIPHKRHSNGARPRSPASPVDAQFDRRRHHGSQSQTREDALRVVDTIRASRARVGADVRKYMSDVNPSSGRSTHRSAGASSSKTPKRSNSGGGMM